MLAGMKAFQFNGNISIRDIMSFRMSLKYFVNALRRAVPQMMSDIASFHSS